MQTQYDARRAEIQRAKEIIEQEYFRTSSHQAFYDAVILALTLREMAIMQSQLDEFKQD